MKKRMETKLKTCSHPFLFKWSVLPEHHPAFPQFSKCFLESVSSFNHDNVSVAKNSRLILVFTSHKPIAVDVGLYACTQLDSTFSTVVTFHCDRTVSVGFCVSLSVYKRECIAE